tara:strand:- start:148 stop:342 length:195 start_codon:yes stop_codon:yes gene_type:complete
MVLHTSVGRHKSCGCKACQIALGKMKPIKKIPKIKKLGKGKVKFGKKQLIGNGKVEKLHRGLDL